MRVRPGRIMTWRAPLRGFGNLKIQSWNRDMEHFLRWTILSRRRNRQRTVVGSTPIGGHFVVARSTYKFLHTHKYKQGHVYIYAYGV